MKYISSFLIYYKINMFILKLEKDYTYIGILNIFYKKTNKV